MWEHQWEFSWDLGIFIGIMWEIWDSDSIGIFRGFFRRIGDQWESIGMIHSRDGSSPTRGAAVNN